MRIKFYISLLVMLMPFCVLAQADKQLGSPTNFALAIKPYAVKLKLQNVEFDISSPNALSRNIVTINAIGIKEARHPMSVEVEGRVTGAEVADLNKDGYPEVYIYLNASDVDQNGSLLAFASNKNNSMTPIFLPALANLPKDAVGYQGRDEFAIVENKLLRRFPIGMNGKVKKYRQIQYQLIPREAGWLLKPNQVTEF